MAALREIFAEFGVNFDRRRNLERGNRRVDQSSRRLEGLGRTAGRVGQQIGAMAAAFSVAATATAFQQLISSTVESTTELRRWSERLGISLNQMDQWHRVSRQFGGDMDDITDVLKELQLKARDAMSGTQSMIDSFAMIGLTVEDLAPVVNDQTALMDLFTTALNNNTSAATRNFVVDELMSDAGTRLMPMFRAGTTELQRLRREADRMGGRTIAALAKRTGDYVRAQRRLSLQWTEMKNKLVLQLIPAVITLFDKIGEGITLITNLKKHTRILEGVMIASIMAVVATLAATAGVWGPWVAGVFAVAIPLAIAAALIDDIIVSAEGGKGVFRDIGLAAGDAIRWLISQSETLISLWSSAQITAAGILRFFESPPTQFMDFLKGVRDDLVAILTLGGRISGLFSGLTGGGVSLNTATSGGQAVASGAGVGSAIRGGLGTATRAIYGGGLGRLGIPGISGGTPSQASIQQSPAAQLRRTEVNAPATVTVNVTEAQDPAATANRIQGQIDASWQRQLRQVTAAAGGD